MSATAAGERLDELLAEAGPGDVQARAAEPAAFIAERDSGRIDDEVLRAVLHGLDLEEATLNQR